MSFCGLPCTRRERKLPFKYRVCHRGSADFKGQYLCLSNGHRTFDNTWQNINHAAQLSGAECFLLHGRHIDWDLMGGGGELATSIYRQPRESPLTSRMCLIVTDELKHFEISFWLFVIHPVFYLSPSKVFKVTVCPPHRRMSWMTSRLSWARCKASRWLSSSLRTLPSLTHILTTDHHQRYLHLCQFEANISSDLKV